MRRKSRFLRELSARIRPFGRLSLALKKVDNIDTLFALYCTFEFSISLHGFKEVIYEQ